MKKNIVVLLILLVICSMSSMDGINEIDLSFMALNKIIHEFYYQEVGADTLGFRADSPWLLNYDHRKVLLFNSESIDGFQTVYRFPKTNHRTQFKHIHSGFMPDFSEYRYLFEEKNVLYLNLDKEFYNLNNLSNSDRIDLLVFLAQNLYITYLKNYNRELISLPTFHYPVTDVENLVLATIEYNILVDAFKKSLEIRADCSADSLRSDDEVMDLLRQFYSIRVRRWRSQAPFVHTFEQSQEKILGLSYFTAFQLLEHLERVAGSERVLERRGRRFRPLQIIEEHLPESLRPRDQFNRFVADIFTIDILHDKLHSILDGTMISINSMSREKAEVKGFLLASIYSNLRWDYRPETTQQNFHAFLGTQLAMSSAEIDSTFNAVLASVDVEFMRAVANETRTAYISNFNGKKANYNLQIFFDHYTDDFFATNEVYFINSEDRNILFPKVSRYKVKSPWIEIEIQRQGFLYHIDRRNKNIQTMLCPNTVITIDDKRLTKEEIDAYLSNNETAQIEFSTLSFTSENINFRANTPGKISLTDGLLAIKVIPRLRFFVEEEYWEQIEELNRRLIARGVPENWLADNINHEKFRIYHSVVRHFTNMPEHQVGRGERDQNWYMRHFGVDQRIRRGADFRREHRRALLAAERRHGIHYELLMAILAMESDYANPRWRGNFYTFGTLVSQYLLLPRRQRFAVNELVALYEFSTKTNKDVYHFIGSFAGAAGWGQFIPSSMNNFFINANDNFYEVDIFSIDDTLHSISNYLFHHGLNRQNIGNRQTLFRAVRSYNHSDAYVRAVLHIYDELRKQRR